MAGLKAILKGCFAFLFALFLTWQQSAAFAGTRSLEFLNSEVLLQDARASQHPYETASLPGQDVAYDNELEEDLEPESDLLNGNFSSASLRDLSFGADTLSHSSCSIQHGAPVPYFILYHSWKSFLI